MLIFTGCNGSKKTEEVKETTDTLNKINLKEAWPVRFSNDELRTPYEQNSGWQNYYTREFESSMLMMEGDALARLHLEFSALYRQALVLHANATIHAYEGYKNDLDPPQVTYLLALAHLFKNDLEKAQSYLSKHQVDPQTESGARQWTEWLASDKKKSPSLEGFFFSADRASANRPPKENNEVYSFGSGETALTASEGTSLWLRALWHEAEAKKMLKEKPYGKGLVSAMLNPWRLPFEKNFTSTDVTSLADIPDEWFLFNFYLNTADIEFVGSIASSPRESLKKWTETSILAQNLSKCVKEEKLNVECVVDQASALEKDIQNLNKESKVNTEGVNTELLYDIFPKFARYSLLRTAALWAEENGQHEDSGRFRLLVRESTGVIRDPLFLTSLAAWCAGNEDTLRSADLVHELSKEFSSLQSARIPLDSLHIRVGRDRPHNDPTH